MSFRPYGSKVSFAVALALGLAAPGYGQNAPAPNGSGQTPQLNEIIVTAQRVAQRALDVPISMEVYDQRQLSNLNIVSTADLATYSPALSVNNQFGNDFTTFSIRGFSQAIQTTPSVAVYFADAVTPRAGDVGETAGDGAGPGDLFDLQNVQVLEGPQGTLFGLNTTGGDVLLVPKMPTSQFGGYVEGTWGNYGLNREQAVLNLPVSDALRVRLGVDHEEQNGYLRNVSGIGPSNFDNTEYTAVRLSAVLDITPNLQNYVVGNYTLSLDNGPMAQMFACNPTSSLGLFCSAQFAKQETAGAYAVQNDEPDAQEYLRQFQVVDTTTWQASDNLTVKNIFNYGQIRASQTYQVFGTDFSIPTGFPVIGGTPFSFTDENPPAGGTNIDQYTFSDELQLHGTALADKLSWQGGGYIERSAPIGGFTASLSENAINCSNVQELDCTDVLGLFEGEALGYGTALEGSIGGVEEEASQVKYNDLAAFGQATYSFTSRLKLTGGLRYTTDWTDANIEEYHYSFYAPDVPTETCVNSAVTSLAEDCRQSFSQKSDAPTWLVDLQYYLRQNTMLYAKYARGYREGGVDVTAPVGYNLFAPEHVDDFEIGEKSSFDWPVPGSFNVDAYYNRFTNQQLLVGEIGPPGVSPVSFIANAGKSRLYGAEIQGMIRPFKGLSLSASYEYLETELLSATPIQVVPPYTTVEYPTTAGGELPWAPRSKVSANATYALPLPSTVGDVEVGATYTYTGRTFIAATYETPYGTQPSYSLVNMNLDWNDIFSSHLDAELFATNLANKLYSNNTSQLYDAEGFEVRWLGPPRMYGVRVRWRFGED
jgi:iron complex outermembrane recepter protein